MSGGSLAGLLWPRPARRPSRRKSVLAIVRVRAGRVRFAWAVPLFLVDDLLEGAVLYGAWAGPWGRRLAGGLLPAWRQLRWSGPAHLVDIRVADFVFVLRLV
jgi:hypothetical protein